LNAFALWALTISKNPRKNPKRPDEEMDQRVEKSRRVSLETVMPDELKNPSRREKRDRHGQAASPPDIIKA
jgi:hypothetical protein